MCPGLLWSWRKLWWRSGWWSSSTAGTCPFCLSQRHQWGQSPISSPHAQTPQPRYHPHLFQSWNSCKIIEHQIKLPWHENWLKTKFMINYLPIGGRRYHRRICFFRCNLTIFKHSTESPNIPLPPATGSIGIGEKTQGCCGHCWGGGWGWDEEQLCIPPITNIEIHKCLEC